MMGDRNVIKYRELLSKVEYDNNEKEKLFETVTKRFKSDNNIRIEKANDAKTGSGVNTDHYRRRTGLIFRLSAVFILFAFILLLALPGTRSKIENLYNRLLQTNETTTPHITPHYTSTPEKTPSITDNQTPVATNAIEYMDLDTEKTRQFTDEEEILNNIYHAIVPDRSEYIAYWTNDKIFWAPAHLEGKITYGAYADIYRINHSYVELAHENGKILFLEGPVSGQLHYRNLYCVRFADDTDEVLSKRYDTYHVEDGLSYRVFTSSGKFYLAFSRNTWEHGELYSSEIISCDTMELVWCVQDLYPDTWELHKVVLTEDGIEIYNGQRQDNHLVNIELVKTIPYIELLKGSE